jgi:outer membrane protein OmpA-like peptidoglycan-associated protein
VDQLASQVAEARRVADAATQAANEVEQQAGAAAAKADVVDGRLTRALANRLKRNPVQQVDVIFASGKANLSPAAQAALQGVVKLLADNPAYTADVVGYTDLVGDKE